MYSDSFAFHLPLTSLRCSCLFMRLAVVTTSASSSSNNNNNNNIPFAIAAIYSRISSENRGGIRRLFVGRGGGSYFRLGSHPHRRETKQKKRRTNKTKWRQAKQIHKAHRSHRNLIRHEAERREWPTEGHDSRDQENWQRRSVGGYHRKK